MFSLTNFLFFLFFHILSFASTVIASLSFTNSTIITLNGQSTRTSVEDDDYDDDDNDKKHWHLPKGVLIFLSIFSALVLAGLIWVVWRWKHVTKRRKEEDEWFEREFGESSETIGDIFPRNIVEAVMNGAQGHDGMIVGSERFEERDTEEARAGLVRMTSREERTVLLDGDIGIRLNRHTL